MRTTRRTAVAAGLALALGLGVTAQASAGGPRSVSGKPSDNITRIANFYGAYIDAVIDEDGKLADDLRKHYLTPAFQKELKAWEESNHANGVLQAQNVPLAWKVTDNGTAKYTEAVVTLTWGGSNTTKLIVDMTRDSHKIFHIGTTGVEVG
ncbi:hypothetical protein [Streptomyces sp. NBC_00199]|uniref:hypothetical protein n=1 Tax=Streptomyces sp. NBC_00199 TaxID=2975678 RepID=UPI0022554B05|nr:hypothetical protein [Streptomyces sp. NBC_00199]MCX5268239.1 hypothetical protein [Streptomyces sp. NBC_00199]